MPTYETLEVRCPKCNSVHRYLMDVKRSIVLENMPLRSSYAPIKKSFKRLFSCPNRNDDFEAVILLIETLQSKIESVEVKGLAKEEPDGDN